MAVLWRHYGPQEWWPAQSRFEVIVGAYLTQNTSWNNVELAIKNLRRTKALNLARMRSVSKAELERLLRPSGYFRQKAKRLKTFIRFLDTRYGGSLERMFQSPTAQLREELLQLNGVGPETADSLLLYAGGHPVFVVDSYTRRVFERHGLVANAISTNYDDLRLTIESAVHNHLLGKWKSHLAARNPRHRPSRMSRASRSDAAHVFSELHALLVRVGNEHCRKRPKCEGCPLRRFLPTESSLAAAAAELTQKSSSVLK